MFFFCYSNLYSIVNRRCLLSRYSLTEQIFRFSKRLFAVNHKRKKKTEQTNEKFSSLSLLYARWDAFLSLHRDTIWFFAKKNRKKNKSTVPYLIHSQRINNYKKKTKIKKKKWDDAFSVNSEQNCLQNERKECVRRRMDALRFVPSLSYTLFLFFLFS